MNTMEIVRLNEEIYKLKKKFRKKDKPDLYLSMWLRLKRAIRKFRGKL